MGNGKVIAFFGSEKYEILLYLSRILYNLNKRVLLVDFAEGGALTESIPIPEILNESNTYLEYRGVDFIKGNNYYLDMENNYDYVLFDFGFNQKSLESIDCDNIIYVTDLQLHNARRIKITKVTGNPKRHILIKDVFPCSITPETILLEIDPKAKIENIYVIEQDALDIKYKIQSQYSQTFCFDKLSKPMKTFLKDLIFILDNNLSKTQITSAYKKAERGQ